MLVSRKYAGKTSPTHFWFYWQLPTPLLFANFNQTNFLNSIWKHSPILSEFHWEPFGSMFYLLYKKCIEEPFAPCLYDKGKVSVYRASRSGEIKALKGTGRISSKGKAMWTLCLVCLYIPKEERKLFNLTKYCYHTSSWERKVWWGGKTRFHIWILTIYRMKPRDHSTQRHPRNR